MITATPDLDTLNEQQLRALARKLLATVSEREALLLHKDHNIRFKEATIAKLTHEIAVLRRYQFGKKSEQVNGVQGSLLEEAVAADIAAIEEKLKQLTSAPTITEPRAQPKRAALPAQLPRIDIHHEPHDTTQQRDSHLRPSENSNTDKPTTEKATLLDTNREQVPNKKTLLQHRPIMR